MDSDNEFWEELGKGLISHENSNTDQSNSQNKNFLKRIDMIRSSNEDQIDREITFLRSFMLESKRKDIRVIMDKYNHRLFDLQDRFENMNSILESKENEIRNLTRDVIEKEINLTIPRIGKAKPIRLYEDHTNSGKIAKAIEMKIGSLREISDMYKEQNDEYMQRYEELNQEIKELTTAFEQEFDEKEFNAKFKEEQLRNDIELIKQQLTVFRKESDIEIKVNEILIRKQRSTIQVLENELKNAKIVLKSPRLTHKFNNLLTHTQRKPNPMSSTLFSKF